MRWWCCRRSGDWRLSGQPSGKHLAAVMDDTLARLARFRELGKVQSRVSPGVLDELRLMSAATIDRYLKPHKDAAHPVALSGTRPSLILRSSIPTRTSMDDPLTVLGFLELDTVAHSSSNLHQQERSAPAPPRALSGHLDVRQPPQQELNLGRPRSRNAG